MIPNSSSKMEQLLTQSERYVEGYCFSDLSPQISLWHYKRRVINTNSHFTVQLLAYFRKSNAMNFSKLFFNFFLANLMCILTCEIIFNILFKCCVSGITTGLFRF